MYRGKKRSGHRLDRDGISDTAYESRLVVVQLRAPSVRLRTAQPFRCFFIGPSSDLSPSRADFIVLDERHQELKLVEHCR